MSSISDFEYLWLDDCWSNELERVWKEAVVTCSVFNPLNAKLNHNCHLLALLGTHPILHVSRIRVNDPSFVWRKEKNRGNPKDNVCSN